MKIKHEYMVKELPIIGFTSESTGGGDFRVSTNKLLNKLVFSYSKYCADGVSFNKSDAQQLIDQIQLVINNMV